MKNHGRIVNWDFVQISTAPWHTKNMRYSQLVDVFIPRSPVSHDSGVNQADCDGDASSKMAQRFLQPKQQHEIYSHSIRRAASELRKKKREENCLHAQMVRWLSSDRPHKWISVAGSAYAEAQVNWCCSIFCSTILGANSVHPFKR